jgi:hypothetical protein
LTTVVAGEVAEPAAEETGEVAELTTVVTGDVAEPIADVAEVAEPGVEVTGGAGEVGVEESADAGDVCVDVRGDRAAVAAWAGWENRSMTAKIPAAASAACTAVRAMRRTNGCMSSSHSTRTGSLAYPPAAEQTSRTRKCCSATTVQSDRRRDKGERSR